SRSRGLGERQRPCAEARSARSGGRRFLIGDVDQSPFDDGHIILAIDEGCVFHYPHGASVLAAEAVLEIAHAASFLQLGREIAATLRLKVQIGGPALHNLAARGKAQDSAKGIVTVQNSPIQRASESPRQVSFKQQPVPLLAGLQLPALGGIPAVK